MKHPIHLNIQDQFPDVRITHKPPASSTYRIAYSNCTCWETEDFTIVVQDYDGKDAYLSWIEIRAKENIEINISIMHEDLYWIYQLTGTTSFKEITLNSQTIGAYSSLRANQYALFYSSKDNFTIPFKTGHHHFFFYILNANWQERYANPVPKQLRVLTSALYTKKKGFLSSNALPIHAAIRTEILYLSKLPKQNGINTDAMIYVSLAKLYVISKEDLNGKRIAEEKNELKTIEEIRRYILGQVQVSNVPTIEEIAIQFNISSRNLRAIHKKEYGYTLQSFITQKRILFSANLLTNSETTITAIAYGLGYDLREFRRQFKNHFNETPSRYRKRRKN